MEIGLNALALAGGNVEDELSEWVPCSGMRGSMGSKGSLNCLELA
jgi:hypothetical protein